MDYFSQSALHRKSHDCYKDLKNSWKPTHSQTDVIFQVFIVFLLGFLCSQISFFLARLKTEQVYIENPEIYIDYALDTNGGKILEQYSSEEYHGWLALFSNNKKSALINQNNEPGHCWAFDGQYSYVGIQLGARILPRNFTIYHLNSVKYFTAPRRVNVYSIGNEEVSLLLASYYFDLEVKGVKRKNWGMFSCQFFCDQFTDRILLEVTENYGANATCVYQFRVHGISL